MNPVEPEAIESPKQELIDFTVMFGEMKTYLNNDLISDLLIPGVTRPSLIQVEKHIHRMSRKKPTSLEIKELVASGILLGELIRNKIPEAKWNMEAPDFNMLRLEIKDEETGASFSYLPIQKVFFYFQTKDMSHSLVKFYDKIVNSIEIKENL